MSIRKRRFNEVSELKHNTNKQLSYYYEHFRVIWDSIFTLFQVNNKREICFVKNNKYYRYKAFLSAEQLRSELLKYCPQTVHLGGMYNLALVQRKKLSTQFEGIGKEFVIDIDLNDYDDVRSCCQGKNDVCQKCWVIIKCAVEVLQYIFEFDFGCEVMFVFSGRRGIHGWIFDQTFVDLDGYGRRQILHYIGRRNLAIVETIEQRFKICMKYFILRVSQENIFARDTYIEKIHSQIKNINIKHQFMNWVKTESGNALNTEACVSEFIGIFDNFANKNPSLKDDILINKMEIIFDWVYPRLDEAVSKDLTHLTKMPFSVHPVTSKISLVMQASDFEDFDPLVTPTVSMITSELKSLKLHRKFKWKHSQLKRYILNLEHFAKKINST